MYSQITLQSYQNSHYWLCDVLQFPEVKVSTEEKQSNTRDPVAIFLPQVVADWQVRGMGYW